MTRHASNGWQDLQAEMLAQLAGDDFEAFCEALVRFEAYDRHDDPEVDGGARKYVADGGRDLLLTVKRQPASTKLNYQKTHHVQPITEDPIAGRPQTRTVYSCKGPTTSKGKPWLNQALKDAKKHANRAVEVLAEGGYVKLLINQRETLDAKSKDGEKQTPHERLRNAFWDRLREHDQNAEDPGDRIQIIEAGTLAAYLRARRPEGGEMDKWLERLGLNTVLTSLEQWRSVHVEDRQAPRLVEDETRTQIRNQLLDFVKGDNNDSEGAVACVVGKPGVGKTRLVLESLGSDPVAAQRTRVALSAAEATDVISSGEILRRYPDLLLVVDDCLSSEVRGLASLFRGHRQRGRRARLLLLLPASFDAVRGDLAILQAWSLEPLDPEHTQTVVSNELGKPKDDADVVAIARFSEGFPWFARLLALEFRQAGRAPADMAEAVRWALASQSEQNSPVDLRELRLERARVLLAASLTSSTDWDGLSKEKRNALASAVGLESWQLLKDTANECVTRGILRRSLGWTFKYVTPQVLEREVILLLLGPHGPDGGGRMLRDFGAEYIDVLLATLDRLNLSDRGLIDLVCDVALENLRHTDLQSFGASGPWGARLRFLARHRPRVTGHVLRRLIEDTSTAELRSAHGRRDFVWALEELLMHDEAFDDAEVVLFRLAQAESESYANNATGVWAALFHIAFHPSVRPLHQRLTLLTRRVSDADDRGRLVALKGLESMLTMWPTVALAVRKAEPTSVPTPDEIREARLRAWSLLCERFADTEPAVAKAAKDLALKHLRAALRFDIGQDVMSMIEAQVACFSADERIRLREKLEEIREYDSADLDPMAAQPAGLELAVAPQSFGERLRQRVGVWGPASLRGDDSRLDDELALEGVREAAPLRAELEWLTTEQAQRAHVFAFAIGRADVEGLFFDDLRQLARAKPNSWKAQALVARYIGGAVEAGRREQAESFVRAMQGCTDEASATALAFIEVGATPERLTWLEHALHAGALQTFAIEEIGRRGKWLERTSEDEVLELLRVLAAGQQVEWSAALDLFMDRYQRGNPPAQALSILEDLLSKLAPANTHGMGEYYWELGAKMLVSHGMAARAAELSVIVLMREHGSNDFAWNVLHHAAERDPTGAFWAVADGLDVPGAGGRLLMAFWFHRTEFVWPPADVLAWVGDDERRGRAAAGIVRVRGDALPEVLRGLIRRFGPRSSVAREIMRRVESTDGMVRSLADHAREQLERARHWLADSDPAVAAFAEQLVADLEQQYERHAAHEEFERRRYGT